MKKLGVDGEAAAVFGITTDVSPSTTCNILLWA
jgi:hypothetical protein